MTNAHAWNAFYKDIREDRIEEAVANVQIMVRTLEARPELTRDEFVRVRMAADVLSQTVSDIRTRLAKHDEPNTTIFTVI